MKGLHEPGIELVVALDRAGLHQFLFERDRIAGLLHGDIVESADFGHMRGFRAFGEMGAMGRGIWMPVF